MATKKVLKIKGSDIFVTPRGREVVFLETNEGELSLAELVEILKEANNIKGKLVIEVD